MTVGLLLIDPKYDHNVGAAVRAAAIFGADWLHWTGNRVDPDVSVGERLPREERMREYGHVDFRRVREAGCFEGVDWEGMTPVAVEVDHRSQPLPLFEHPENAVYVFGPEDGSLRRVHRMHCHRHVVIPAASCLNLAAAVNVVLYDRIAKECLSAMSV